MTNKSNRSTRHGSRSREMSIEADNVNEVLSQVTMTQAIVKGNHEEETENSPSLLD